MVTTLAVISTIFILLSVLPFIQHQHWLFRVAEFIKIQLVILQIIAFGITMIYVEDSIWLWIVQTVQFILIVYHIYILMRYTKFWKKQKPSKTSSSSDKINIISCNIYQFNSEYHRFIELIEKEQPDIFVTMESNADWEKALQPLEKDYPYQKKVPLENTYGMHLYTKLKVHNIQTHYFVADDVPSIEAELETNDGHRFIFFAVHPPPPSPTEEDNSKERDGDLLAVAKKVRDYALPVVVTGDFNNVAWARSSILFKKTSELIDARIGRGILSTFHAKYWFFRVPLDLLFHSTTIIIDKLFIYPSVGSDHFPIGCTFHIDLESDDQEEEVKHLENGEMQEVDELIADGKAEESENR
ncbi:endonuclease/exonuclease/phosphatase family protein [Sphingobacterium corticibacterium]|uniref:Endonuclease/exonuclease/phosphatase family protein n=1 Tax=Sphingobacterium corticibacterium TaxID=2484746 RepID=A0A4Q6XXI4_9SPHI|nr:endonuclease/exonuclease/phosphatase family protein [Sphingobacterium corticibacterium]RZF61517.1 endonuclease/exonuclease/phosphatase family protein [Sphingobacterium corticibacterium]